MGVISYPVVFGDGVKVNCVIGSVVKVNDVFVGGSLSMGFGC